MGRVPACGGQCGAHRRHGPHRPAPGDPGRIHRNVDLHTPQRPAALARRCPRAAARTSCAGGITMKLTVGLALYSAVDSTAVIVVRAPEADATVTCGGTEMTTEKPAAESGGSAAPAEGGTLLG